MRSHARQRAFDSREDTIETLQEAIQTDGRTRDQIAIAAGLSKSTVNNIATGTTRWPRHTTFFPLCAVRCARPSADAGAEVTRRGNNGSP